MAQEQDKKVIREFRLSTFSIKNSTSIIVLIFIILLAGLMSYRAMPKESFPEIVIPTIYVGVSYPGNSPVDMENLITRPIEKEIKEISGISKFYSTSIQDYSTIIAEFEFDVNPAEALTDVKDAVDRAKPELPNDLPTEPNVFELDFTEFPVMNVNLFGDFSYEELKEHAEYLQDEFEKLPEISGADIRGLPEKEVKVHVDLFQLESLEISLDDIEGAIAAENVTISGGDILSVQGGNLNRRSLRIAGEFTDPQQLNDVIVKNENQRTVYLRDIADVSFGSVEPTSYARLDGKPVVSLDVKKKGGENLLDAAAQIRSIVDDAKESRFPRGLQVVITNDQSKFTQDIVNSLENSIISGVILVVLVLLFFLGARNAMFVGIAIPLSMLMGIAVINYTGNTLNMMVLFSLILALGMLVDNGIVVVENIYRLKSQGDDNETASRHGVGEVAMPIIASTFTTLLAFLPLLFWKDLMGEFMKFLPLTLIIVLTSSLFVGLVVNPVLTTKLMRIEQRGTNRSRRFWIVTGVAALIGALLIMSPARAVGTLILIFALIRVLHRHVLKPFSFFFQERILSRIERAYERTIRFVLGGLRPIFFFIGMFVLLIGALMYFGARSPKITFFPDNIPNYVNVFIEMPLGTDIQRTNEVTKLIEQKVNAAIEPNRNIVEAVLAQVGEGTSDPNEGPSQGSSPHKARVTVSFYEFVRRIDSSSVSTSVVMQDIREAVSGIAETKSITVGKDPMGPPVGPPISIEISAEEFDELIVVTDRVRRHLDNANVPGVDQLKTDLEEGKPELILNVDRDAARRFGISTGQVGGMLRTALFGKEVSKFKQGEDDYPIQLRLKDEQRYDLPVLLNSKVTFMDQNSGRIVQVPVSAVTDIENSSTLGSVKRKDMERVITIYSNVKEGYNANLIVAKYKALLAEHFEENPLPAGFTVKFTGEQEEQGKSFAFLQRAMMIAVFLIFLILVSQFNSVILPGIIMFSVIFSTIGVFVGFATFNMPMSILMVGIGIISLAGVVVNNAIVLIDYINLLRKRRKAELGIDQKEVLPYKDIVESIVQGGRTRLRPVLLTAITTVLGLVPLAIGLNIDFGMLLSSFDPNIYIGGDSVVFWGPMAWTIIFGLIFATFLTLVIVPVMYLLSDKVARRARRLFASA